MSEAIQRSSIDLFEKGSEPNHLALERLAEVLRDIGFSVRKKTRSESTLRVYVRKQNQYPLLNPRFVRSCGTDQRLTIKVFSKGADASLDSTLATFQNSPACKFEPLSGTLSGSYQGYRIHGRFVIPLSFASGADVEQLALSELSRSFSEIHRLLIKHS